MTTQFDLFDLFGGKPIENMEEKATIRSGAVLETNEVEVADTSMHMKSSCSRLDAVRPHPEWFPRPLSNLC